MQSPTSHLRQYIVVHFFTVFPVWRLLLSAVTRHERGDFPSSLAFVTGILHMEWSLPNKSASLTVSLILHLNFRPGTREQSFGDFFVENYQQHFFLACFVMQDVCSDNYQVE
jgi:hypothetical protein